MSLVIAIASSLVGLLVTLVMIVMLLAGGANANATTSRRIKWSIASVAGVQLFSLALSIALWIDQQSWLAVGAGQLPVIYAVVLVAVLVKLQW